VDPALSPRFSFRGGRWRKMHLRGIGSPSKIVNAPTIHPEYPVLLGDGHIHPATRRSLATIVRPPEQQGLFITQCSQVYCTKGVILVIHPVGRVNVDLDIDALLTRASISLLQDEHTLCSNRKLQQPPERHRASLVPNGGGSTSHDSPAILRPPLLSFAATWMPD
jgi:hypothetical protein